MSLPFKVRPLNVLKQVAVMALATTTFKPGSYHMGLRRFVLRPKTQALPPDYRFYIYFNPGGQPRLSTMAAVLDLNRRVSNLVLGEVALYPLGYVFCLIEPEQTSLPNRLGMADISNFRHYQYDELRTVYLRVPRLTPSPDPFHLTYAPI